MRTYTRTVVTLALLLLYSFLSYATSYTWKGNTNTHWYTSTNWSPNGIPGSSDNVTVATDTGAFNLLMDSSKTITTFTISGDSIDVAAYTLTISSTATFSGGTINSSSGGLVKVSSTATTTLSGTIFNVPVDAASNSILLNGSVFNSTFTGLKKSGSSSHDNGTGGNIFNGAVTLTDTSAYNLVLSNNSSSPDTFFAAVTLNAASTGAIYVAHRGTGNAFKSTLTIKGGTVYLNYYGTAYYDGNISINAPGGNINFGTSTGTSTLMSTRTISIASGGLTSGTLTLRNFTQDDSSLTDTLTATNTATISFEDGSVFKGNLVATAPQLKINGSRFLGSSILTHTSSSSSGFTSGGGSYFGGTTIITRNSSGTGNWTLGGTSADTLASGKSLLIQNQNTGAIILANGIFKGKVDLKNQVGGSNKFSIRSCTFSDSLTLENTSGSGGINFGNVTGITVLDSSARLYIPSAFTGYLRIKNVTQYGTSGINIPFQSNTSAVTFDTLCVFNGPVRAEVQKILLNGSTFNNTFYLKRTGNSTDDCDGGNVFNGTTVICDSVNNTTSTNKIFSMANMYADDYNGDVTFKQYGTGSGAAFVKLYPGYTKNSSFAGNLTVDGSSAIALGANGGKVIFDGSGVQTISKTGSFDPTVKNVDLNKGGGYLKLSVPLQVDTLGLIRGIVISDTVNLLSIPDDGYVIHYGGLGGTDTGYVYGPVKKTGNDSFFFPTGDTILHSYPYHPLQFSTAPSSTSSAYTVQYFAHGSGITDDNITDSAQVSTCEFWNLRHDSVSDSVKIALWYNYNNCPVGDISKMVVMEYKVGIWKNLGQGGYSASVASLGYAAITAGETHPVTIGIYSSVHDTLITPDTSGSNTPVVHVPKWEKYEIGIQLPQEYISAIDSYRDHRILASDTVDHRHDLNPYADDSLQMVMTLTSPSGRTITKYGFFMREAQWVYNSTNTDYDLDTNETGDLGPYNVRFRIAPDEDSTVAWTYSLYIAAPHTQERASAAILLPIYYSGSFVCGNPLASNHGFLKVNQTNKRFLKFDDGTPFFGIGENMADLSHFYNYDTTSALRSPNLVYNKIYKLDYLNWVNMFRELDTAGANYACLFFLNRTFTPEYEHLGWYDQYNAMPYMCQSDSDNTLTATMGNRQWGLWAFDKIMDEAHADGIYIQLNLDYKYPHDAFQTDTWGGDCYVHKYIYTHQTPPYPHPEYYWIGKDSSDANDPGALYFWKRNYKYVMARWGYSTNIAMFQLATEIDQALAYYKSDSLTSECPDNNLHYDENENVPAGFDTFIDTITNFVKNTLGDSTKLFTVSHNPPGFINGWSQTTQTRNQYYRHQKNPNIDVVDLHFYNNDSYGTAAYDKDVQLARYLIEEDVHGSDTATQFGLDKPFHFGEGSNTQHREYFADPFGGTTDTTRYRPISDVYDNYEVSFHNEIWATSMMNSATCLMSYQHQIIHWLPYGMVKPRAESFNPNPTNVLGDTNVIKPVGGPIAGLKVANKKIQNHYQKLSDFMNSNLVSAHLLNDNFNAKHYYDSGNNIECYYMVNSSKDFAIGWVHNLNAYWNNHYYFLNSIYRDENFYGCSAPSTDSIFIDGFQSGYSYDMWYERSSFYSSILPYGYSTHFCTLSGLPIDFSAAPLGCKEDSLPEDYAFIIERVYPRIGGSSIKNSAQRDSNEDFDFSIYPNPNDGLINLGFGEKESGIKEIVIYDMSGREIYRAKSITGSSFSISTSLFAKGVYYIMVKSETRSKVKRVAVQ